VTPSDHQLAYITARAHERDARLRYEAALAAAFESLRRAEQRFEQVSAAIEAHIQAALAAALWARSAAG
jgi:hypothetical protein